MKEQGTPSGEKEKKRGTSKLRKGPRVKQARREDSLERRRRDQRKRPEPREEARNPKGPSVERQRMREETPGREKPRTKEGNDQTIHRGKGKMAKDSRCKFNKQDRKAEREEKHRKGKGTTPTNREDRTNPGKKRKGGRGSRTQSQEGKTRNSRPKPDEQPE